MGLQGVLLACRGVCGFAGNLLASKGGLYLCKGGLYAWRGRLYACKQACAQQVIAIRITGRD